jgi:hypothetical protein
VWRLLTQELTSFITGTLTEATVRLQKKGELYKAYNCYNEYSTIRTNTNSITMQCKPLKSHLLIATEVKLCITKVKTNRSFMVKKSNILTYTKSFEHMYLRSGSLGVQKQPKYGNYRL